MGKADSLSKRLDQEVGVKRDNENEILVKLEWLKMRRTETVEIIVEGVDLLKKVRQSKVKDEKVVKTVEEMKRTGIKIFRDEEWKEMALCIRREKSTYLKTTN